MRVKSDDSVTILGENRTGSPLFYLRREDREWHKLY